MSEKLTKEILSKKGEYKIRVFDLLFPHSKTWTECVYLPFFPTFKKRKLRLLGSNMGFTKDILEKINGFNEEYEGAGIGEDTDLEWRFSAIKARYKASKNTILQYHLYHTRSERNNSLKGNEILEKTRSNNEWRTKKGLEYLK